MPPKAKTDEFEPDAGVNALIHMLTHQDPLIIHSDKLAAVLGLSGPKNVFRRLNQVLEPYNFKFDHGKIVPTNPSANANGVAAAGSENITLTNTASAAAKEAKESAPSTPVRAKAIASTNNGTETAEKSAKGKKKAPTTPGPKKSSTAGNTASAKKRKAGETTEPEAGTITKKQATIKEKGEERSSDIELGDTATEEEGQQNGGGASVDVELEGEQA